MQRPPTRIDILEKTQFGMPVRALGILAVGTVVGGVIFFALLGVSLFLAATLAVLVAGLGLALAFGEIDGQKPEMWLVHFVDFKRRARYMVKGAQPQAEEPLVTVAPLAEKPEPQPTPKPQPVKLAPSRPAPSFLALSGTAVCAAVLVGLTAYLASGGADRLVLTLQLHPGL